MTAPDHFTGRRIPGFQQVREENDLINRDTNEPCYYSQPAWKTLDNKRTDHDRQLHKSMQNDIQYASHMGGNLGHANLDWWRAKKLAMEDMEVEVPGE